MKKSSKVKSIMFALCALAALAFVACRGAPGGDDPDWQQQSRGGGLTAAN